MRGEKLVALHGLPMGVKDLTNTAGMRTTYGSLLYKDFVPEEDERLVAVLRRAGANVFCKTNTPEFGAGANTTNAVFRSEEHTSELQSLMRSSYAVFCLKKKNKI